MATNEPLKRRYNFAGLFGAIITGGIVAASAALTGGQDWSHIGQAAMAGAVAGAVGWVFPTHKAGSDK